MSGTPSGGPTAASQLSLACGPLLHRLPVLSQFPPLTGDASCPGQGSLRSSSRAGLPSIRASGIYATLHESRRPVERSVASNLRLRTRPARPRARARRGGGVPGHRPSCPARRPGHAGGHGPGHAAGQCRGHPAGHRPRRPGGQASLLVTLAEDRRFELLRGCPQHASNTARPCSPAAGTVRELHERGRHGRQ
jgi:hypothetical protein